MPLPTRFHLRRLVLLVLLFAFAGCGRVAFISDRFDNFTAYYNTFYNAERSYSEGVTALDQTDQAVDRRLYISIFEAPGQGTNDQKFQAAIDKSADVLRDHPESKWVDDALLLIGKSYFYQHNYVGAEQKFREVMALTSPLEDEARFWLARTLIAAGAHDEAREHLLVSLNREDLAARWEPSLRLALGELHVKRGDFESAIEELAEGVESVRENNYRARGNFLLGQVYEAVGRYEEAVEAYRNVLDAHPRYELSYAALYSAVRVQGLYVNADAALQELRRMERDDKHYSNRYELTYLRGRIYQSQDYARDAEALYHEVLYDSEGQINDLRGRVHYALGELYRDAYLDFEMASAHFDTARTALRPPSSVASGPLAMEIDYAPEAITDAEVLSETFGSFATVRSELAEMDSLLYLGSLDDDEFNARILEIRRQMAEALAEEERRAERMQAERGFQNAAASSMDRGLTGADAAQSAGSAGFLFHLDPVRVQEGRMSFLSRWGERPLAPDWRRIDAIQGVAAVADSARQQTGRQLTDLDASVGENPLPPLDYSDVPRDSVSRAALRARRAAARYELANVLFLSMSRPDSAAAWYRTVIEEDAEFPVAQRAFYALAEVHSSLGDSVAARRLYRQVLEDYPESDFAGRVRERLGIRHDVPSDTLALAEQDYESAYERWRRGAYRLAINDMVELAAVYPGLEVAPRALLAAGRIYMEWAQRDTLSLFDPIPLTVSDSTLEDAGLLDVAADSATASNASPPAGSPGSATPTSGSPGAKPDSSAIGDEQLVPGSASGEAAPAVTDTPAAGGSTGVISDEQPAIDSVPLGARRSRDTTAVSDSASAEGEASASDSTRAGSDTVLAAADTLDGRGEAVVVTDSVSTGSTAADARGAAAPDTSEAAVGDVANVSAAGAAGADLIAEADSSVIDSTMAAAFGVNAPLSGLIAAASSEDDHPIYLKTLFAGVKRNYPETAYAGQAQMMLTALEEREAEARAIADSLAAALAAAADTLSAAPAALADTLSIGAVRADSLQAVADSSAHPTQSTDTSADTSGAGADTLWVDDDAPQSGVDSLRAVDDVPWEARDAARQMDPAGQPSDSAATGNGRTLSPAVDSVADEPERIGGASDSLAASNEKRTGSAADSLAAARDGDAAATDSPIDSARDPGLVQGPPDEIDAAPASADAPVDQPPSDSTEATAPAAIPAGEAAIRGDGGIREDLGGFALIIGMDNRAATMRALAEKYAKLGFRTDVLVEEGPDGPVYRAAIGHFATRREAGILLQKYQAQITEPMELAPLSEFE